MHNIANTHQEYNQTPDAQSFSKLDIKNWFLSMAQDDVMIDYMYSKLCNVHRQSTENYNQYFKSKNINKDNIYYKGNKD